MEIYDLFRIWIYLIFATFLDFVYCQVQLTPETLLVNENSSATLTCTYTGSGDVQVFNWYNFIGPPGGSDDRLLADILTSSCEPFDKTPSDKYNYTCLSTNVMTWTIVSFTKADENIHWGCAVGISGGFGQVISNGVYITIRVPVTSIAITKPTITTITWRENTSQVFECKTSVSRPTPTISWYLDYGTTTTDKIIIDNVSQTPSPNENVLQAAVGSLTYRPSRQANGWQLFCSAQNLESDRKLLNVTYPPNSTMMDNYANGSTFFMISNKQQTLTCRSIDGNPRPTLTWTCFNGSKSDSVTGITVSSQWRWTTNTGGQCSCISTHIHGNQSYSVNVEILVAVSDIRFHVSNQEVSGNVEVIHDSVVPIVCSASGSPTISYTWIHDAHTVKTDKQLYPRDILQDGTYTCLTNNVLKPSQGQEQQHNTSSSVDIIRLFPPDVLPMLNQSAEEGKSFTYNCLYTPGNPPDTTVRWYRASDGKLWKSEVLDIVNVTKADGVMYTCTVQNMMKPTNYDIVTFPNSGHMFLYVKYKAVVEEFYVEEPKGTEVTVSEHTSPSLICKVDSDPASNIKILFKNQTLVEKQDSWTLNHVLSNVSCDDIGVYTCEGGNYLNTIGRSTKEIVLFVTCQPQPYGDIKYTIYCTKGDPATLIFSTIAYPNKSSVEWTKVDVTRNKTLTNNSELTMTETSLATSDSYINITRFVLNFHKVAPSDFGQYKVKVRNSIGMVERMFVLKAQVKPDSPDEFITTLIKTTEINVQWKPGFNGGTSQAFVLLYKKSANRDWNTYVIEDNGDTIMNYTFTKLDPDSLYEFMISARNRVGYSSSVAVTVRTSGAESTNTPSAAVIGGVIGGLLAVIILLVIFVILRLRGYRCVRVITREPFGDKENEGSLVYQNDGDDVNAQNVELSEIKDDQSGGNVDLQYESLGTNRENPSTYSALSAPTERSDGPKTYENLS